MNDSLRKRPGTCLGIVLLGGCIIFGCGIVGLWLFRRPASISPPTQYPTLPSAGPTTTEESVSSLPPFPWPPYEPSAIASLTLGSLGQAAGATFHDVDVKISNALAAAGYDEKSYFGVPEGFAIVTRVEHITAAGYPAASDRWVASLEPLSLTEFSLTKYLEALFSAPKGHYRLFVFFITSELVVQSGTPVAQGEAETWFMEGANKLPSDMETLPYTSQHSCTVYVYEFVQSGVGGDANQNVPSAITGRQHLERAGLWESLEE